MLQIFFSLIIIILAIIIIPLLLNYHYKFKFSYDNNYNINICLSTSLYSFQFERFAEDNYINNKSYINFLGLKKEFIKRKSKEEMKKEKEIKKLASKKEKGKEKSSKSKKKVIKNIKENFSDFSSLINRENFEHIFSFVITLLKELKPKGYNLFLGICFSDPYYNGLVLAYYYSIKNTFKLDDFEVEVSWDEARFEVDSELMGELIPINILFITFKFIFSPKSIRLIVSIIRNIKK